MIFGGILTLVSQYDQLLGVIWALVVLRVSLSEFALFKCIMLPPQKPWENVLNQRVQSIIPNSDGIQSSMPNMGPYAGYGGVPTRMRNAPPLPPRLRAPNSRFSSLSLNSVPFGSAYSGGYGNGFNSFSNYGYGSYGGYSDYGNYNSFSMYGPGRNMYGHSMPESRFIQMAEDGSRPAFQSIQSLVHAFGSVSFMLESTFNAMYSSFRAVLGVAENFGRLRALFGQFISVFAVFRWLQWLYRKCLYLLGLSASDPGQERLWREATEGLTGGNVDSEARRSSWPIMVFLGIIFSGPYLMWKLLSSLDIPNVDPFSFKDWKRCKEPILSAVALYDFAATSPQELSFQTGQKVLVAPKDCQQSLHWLMASVDGKNVGLVPANYIKVVGRAVFHTKKSTGLDSSNTGAQNVEPTIGEPPCTKSEEPIIPDGDIPGPNDSTPITCTSSCNEEEDLNQ